MFCDSIKAPNYKVFIETAFSISTKLEAENWYNMKVRTEHEKTPKITLPFNKIDSNYN